MASENETVMAVCAEWRACIEAADPSVWNDERIAGLVKTTKEQQLAYLDRIEAAWKREKAEAEDNAMAVGCIMEAARHKPGNAAAMREALNEIDRVVWDKRRHTKEETEAHRLATEALSKPARNCDVYKTSWDVVTHWDGGLDSTQSVVRMLDWLLAPAAERKGEGDGK